MCARACLNFKAFVSSAKAAKPPVKTRLVPGEPLFPLRQTTAADKAAESQEGSASRAQHPAADWSPSTSTHVRGQSHKRRVFAAPGVLQDDLIYYLARHRK